MRYWITERGRTAVFYANSENLQSILRIIASAVDDVVPRQPQIISAGVREVVYLL